MSGVWRRLQSLACSSLARHCADGHLPQHSWALRTGPQRTSTARPNRPWSMRTSATAQSQVAHYDLHPIPAAQGRAGAAVHQPGIHLADVTSSRARAHDLDAWRYVVEVTTGSVRGAGTPNMATLQLFGQQTCSAVFQIGDDGDNDGGPGFSRNSIKRYAIKAPNLGAIRRVHLKKDLAKASEMGSGWFLEQVVVTGPEGNTSLFPCHAWIGESDDRSGAAEYERNLLPCVQPSTEAVDAAADPISVRAAGMAIPHPDKLKDGKRGVNLRHSGIAGEDAYFYTPGTSNKFGLGVADGIYMWREFGIDSGVFAKTLMDTAQHLVEAGYSDVLRMAQICARKVQSEGVYGSSTFCLAVVDRASARMYTACLGDSGFMVIGTTAEQPDMHVKFRTSPQEHEFGRPYQLGSHPSADHPEDCMFASIKVGAGDVVIMGSDGLWDNLFDRQVAALAERYRAASSAPNPAAMARELTSMAYAESKNRKAFTPYSYAASEFFDMVYDGGKPDDICVVAAFID